MVREASTAQRYLGNLDRNLRAAHGASGLLVEQKAQEYAPVLSGTMMRSVTHTPPLRKRQGYETRVGPGPEAPYAPYTETEDRNLGPKSIVKGTARMPWLRPALLDSREEIRDVFTESIRQARP